jgi:stage III sporulation protein AD
MEMIQIVSLGLLVTLLCMVLKEQKPLYAFFISTCAGVMIFLLLLGKISTLIRMLEGLATHSGVDPLFWKTILKIIGIAYIAEFGAQVIRDTGHESIAAKVELAGKIMIMVMAMPIITVIVETIITLFPG